MADQNLRFRTTNDTSQFVSATNKASQAAGRLQKRSGQANNVILNLTRGVNDARFGFQGLANNLEFVIESFGQMVKSSGGARAALKQIGGAILGPIGIVAGISLLIGYGPEIVQFFKDLASGTNAAAREAEEFNKKLREQLGLLPPENKALASALQEIKDLNAELDELAGREELALETLGFVPEKLQGEIEQVKKQRQAILDSLAEYDINKFEETEKKKAEIAKKNAEALQREIDALLATPTFGDENSIFRELLGGPDTLEGAFGKPEEYKFVDPEVIDEEIDALADLESALIQAGSVLAGLSPQMAADFKAIEDAELTAAEKSQQFAGALIGAFESAATQGGKFLENLARGLLSSLGSILIQQGTAAIFSGIAKNAIVPGSGVASIKKGSLVVAAGVALKAGSSIGRGGAAGGATGGGAAGRSTPSKPTTSITPTSVQDVIGQGRLVAEVDGQQLRFVLQSGNDIYGALN